MKELNADDAGAAMRAEAGILQAAGSLAAAAETFNRAADIERQRGQDGERGLIESLKGLATVYRMLGRNDDAAAPAAEAARLAAKRFAAEMAPVASAEPELDAHEELVGEIVDFKRQPPWLQLVAGGLVPTGMVIAGLSVIARGTVRFYGSHGHWFANGPLVVDGYGATCYGLFLISGAVALHCRMFWPHRNRFVAGYGVVLGVIAASLCLLGTMAKAIWPN